jgi:hypothetical protein
MANIDYDHTKEKSRYNKNDYKKVIEAIFKESIDNIEKACVVHINYEKAYGYYRHELTQIRSRVSERLGKLVADDIHNSMITGRPTQALNPYLSANFLKYIERKMKSVDKAFQTSRRKYWR